MLGLRNSQKSTMKSSQGLWKTEARKENYISKNKKLAREANKRQKVASVPQPRRTTHAGNRETNGLDQHSKRQLTSTKYVETKTSIGGDNVVISKKYLEELLSLKLSTSPSQPTGGRRASPVTRGAATLYQEVGDGAKREGLSLESEVRVEPSNVPGLDWLEAAQPNHVHSGLVQVLNTSCEVNKRQPLLDGVDTEGYFPWGKPGCGAPLRSSSGRLLADYKRLSPRPHEELPNQVMTMPRDQMTTPRVHLSNQAMTTPRGQGMETLHRCERGTVPCYAPTPSAMRSSISFGNGISDESIKVQQNDDRRRWLQELNDQIVQKKMTQDPHLQRQGREQGHTSILIGSVYQDPSPPKAGHFGRGAGPFVDKYVLEERETKKAKENEHYAFLRAQIEEKERKKREEQNLKELEDKREQERLAREQMKLREEHLKELEKARDKEEKATRKHAYLQQKIIEAEKGSTGGSPPSKHLPSEEAKVARSFSPHNMSSVSIVINRSPTPPIQFSSISPGPILSTDDRDNWNHQCSHTDMRSPSLVMFGARDCSPPSNQPSPREYGAGSSQGHTSKQQTGHTSKQQTGHTSKQLAGSASKQLTGSTSKQKARHTSKQLAGSNSKQQAGHTSKQLAGSTFKQQTGHTSKQLAGSTFKQQAGCTSKQLAESSSKQQTEHTSKKLTGSTYEQQTRHTSKKLVGSTSEQQTRYTSKKLVGSTSEQQTRHTSKKLVGSTSEQQTGHTSKKLVGSTSEQQTGHTSKKLVGSTSEQQTMHLSKPQDKKPTLPSPHPSRPSLNRLNDSKQTRSPPRNPHTTGRTANHQQTTSMTSQKPDTPTGPHTPAPPTQAHPSPPPTRLQQRSPPIPTLRGKDRHVLTKSPILPQTPPTLLPSETTFEVVPPTDEAILHTSSELHLPDIPPSSCMVGGSTHTHEIHPLLPKISPSSCIVGGAGQSHPCVLSALANFKMNLLSTQQQLQTMFANQ